MQRGQFVAGLAGLTAAALLIGAALATVQQARDDAAPVASLERVGPDGPAFGLMVPGLVPQQLLGQVANRLGLTVEQRRTINGYFAEARPPFEQLHSQLAANAELLAGTRPDDPSYARIVTNVSQSAGEIATQLVLQGSQLRSRVFGVLTDEQKARLVQLQLQMQGGLEQRRAALRRATLPPDGSLRPD